MSLTVAMRPQPPVVKWDQAKHGCLYRCERNDYLVMCNQSNQAIGLNTSEGSVRKLGDVWTPGSASRWIEVHATITVTGDV